jgi:protein involved in polysaccharide export with SLBB domain
MGRRILLLLATIFCHSFPASAELDFTKHLIGPGDVLSLRVWRQPDLNGKVIVRADGLARLPLLRDVAVAGLTTAELARYCERRYAAAGLRKPQVLVAVIELGKPRRRVDRGGFALARPRDAFDSGVSVRQ